MLKKIIALAVLFGQTLTAGPTPDHFMDALSDDLKLKDLCLLGSHDAGTYELHPLLGVSPDEYGSWLYTVGNWPIIGTIIDSTVIKAWSQAQNSDMTGQLNQGVRYFDLRFAPDGQGDLRACHGLFGPLLGDVLNQINGFLNERPSEIVLLSFSFYDQMGNHLSDDEQAIETIQQAFGTKIAPSSLGANVTLGQMRHEQSQVIIFWNGPARPDLLWDRNAFLAATWYNKQNWNDLEQALDQGLAARPAEMFYVNQAILTPDANMIFTHLFSSLLCIGQSTNLSVLGWYAQKASMGQAGNILMIDNVDSAYAQAFQISSSFNQSSSQGAGSSGQ